MHRLIFVIIQIRLHKIYKNNMWWSTHIRLFSTPWIYDYLIIDLSDLSVPGVSLISAKQNW